MIKIPRRRRVRLWRKNPKSKIQNYKNLKCVILAAGAGTRMNTNLPKALHRISNRTMLERLLQTVQSLGVKDTVAVVGHGLKQVENILKKYNIKAIRQKKLLGSADAVKAAKGYYSKFSGNLLVLYTDTPLISENTMGGLIDKHTTSAAACTLLTTTLKDAAGYGRILRDASGNIAKIAEEADITIQEKEITEVNVGAYCFKKGELFRALGKIKMHPKKKEFYLTDIIGQLRSEGSQVNSLSCPADEALGINSRQDLAVAEKIIRERKIKQLMREGVTFIDAHTAYIDERAKIARDVIIYPSVIIEGNAAIEEGCHIGPFARIRGDSRIGKNCVIGNFVEIVRSKIGSNTKVKHHAYIGDAYVGDNVNIGAGAITANYDGRGKNKTVIKNNAFIGVGAILIAPLKIGRAAVVGAGSVVVKNKNVPDGATVIGVPAKVFKRGGK